MLAMALCTAFGASAQNLPAGAQAIAGQATVSVNGRNMLVTTTNVAGGNHSAIDWRSFSIGSGYSAYVRQPNATSTSINRVVTANPSQIFGALGSNGKLVLVNPSGIAFGAGAVVDTAGFTASTLNMSEADAVAGRLRFHGDANSGTLTVQGQVISHGGDVVLIAPDVEAGSQALVQSQGGAVVLAAGRKVEITGRGLEGINLEVQAPADQAVNLGVLQGDAVAIFAGTLRHSGAIQSQAVSLEGGRVILKAQRDALVETGATITADGGAGKGGRVEILGQTVTLEQGASVNASGDSGGGTILVGGDMQGKNPEVPNAQNTRVASGVTLNANARVTGDGGKVIVWADEATHFAGHISARGGAFGGNGGTAETSGKQVLYFRGTADLTARHGHNGSLLLDPANIIVQGTPDINGDATTGDDITAAGDLGDANLDYPGVTSKITASALTSLLNSADVTLAATDSIRVNSPIVKTGAPITTLTLGSTTIILNSTIGSTGGALNLTLNASGAATLNGRYGSGTRGTLRVTNGTLKIVANAVFDNARVGGNVALTGTGLLTLYNGLALEAGTTFNTGSVSMNIEGTQKIFTTGTATLQRMGGPTNIVGTGTDFTVNAGIVWSGYGNITGSGRLVNQGVIDATTFGRTIDVSSRFVNAGQLKVEGNMIVEPQRWINNGTLVQSGGTFILDASTTLASLAGRITRTGGNFIIRDTLDLQGGTLDIGSGGALGAGGLTLLDSGGTLLNGRLVSMDGTPFRTPTGYYAQGATLDSITIGGNLTMAPGRTIVRHGLTLANGAVLNRGLNTLTLDGSQTIGTPGTATLLSGGGETLLNYGTTLTLGSGLVWQGYGRIYNSSGSSGTAVVNDGTIDANVSGQSTSFSASSFVNSGLMRVSIGSLSFGSGVINAAGGTIQNLGGTLSLPMVSNAGLLNFAAGSNYLDGNFTLSNLTSGLSRTGGSLVFSGSLDLQGGTLDIGSGGALGTGGLTKLNAGAAIRNGTLISGDGTPFRSESGNLWSITIGSDLTIAPSPNWSTTYRTFVHGDLNLASGVTLSLMPKVLDDVMNQYVPGSALLFRGTQGITTTGSARIDMPDGSGLWYNIPGAAEALTIGPGVMISGTGTVGDYCSACSVLRRGLLINHGTLAPGGSGVAGLLTIEGDVDASDGTLQLELGSTASYDKIVVKHGTVTLRDTTVIQRADLAGASYLAGDIFDVIQASTGSIVGPAPVVTGFDSTITSQPAPVYLQLTAQSPAP